MSQERVPIAVIGGSGLYEIEGVEIIDEVEVDTPFGKPSAPIKIGKLGDRRIAFLPRHGVHHELNPSQVPYRANIWALKKLGVFWIVTASAVGSLQEEIVPGHFVIPDQIIDKTYQRANTLYDELTVHVGLSHPFNPMLRDVLIEATKAVGLTVHERGTYVCMEGPAFSSVAESHMHRQWGAHLIGMTAQPEARLAREAEMCYATVALPTDYDVWYERDEVDVAEVLRVLKQNGDNVRRVLAEVIPAIPLEKEEECDAYHACAGAIVTHPDAISDEVRKKYAPVLSKYL